MFSRKGETMDTYYEDILKKVETLMKDAQFAEDVYKRQLHDRESV